MTISERNRENGWTPEIVEWVAKVTAIRTNNRSWRYIVNGAAEDLMKGGYHHGIVLGVLEEEDPDLAALVQALPVEALEVFKRSSSGGPYKWADVATHPGERVIDSAYRVGEYWEVGEYVEDEAVDETEYVFTSQGNRGWWNVPRSRTTRRWERLCDISHQESGGYQFAGFCVPGDVSSIRAGQRVSLGNTPCWSVLSDVGKPIPVGAAYAVWRKV